MLFTFPKPAEGLQFVGDVAVIAPFHVFDVVAVVENEFAGKVSKSKV
jgi:hypothetical protein